MMWSNVVKAVHIICMYLHCFPISADTIQTPSTHTLPWLSLSLSLKIGAATNEYVYTLTHLSSSNGGNMVGINL